MYRGVEARQNAIFLVGEGSFLEYLPHHLIPFAHSNYRQETEIRLAEDAALLAWDAASAGRVARGERFAFGGLSARTRILRETLPEVVDGFELRAGGGESFGGYSYGGAAYVLAPQNLEPLAERLHGVLREVPRVLASASAPTPRLCTVRVLARDATALYRALNACRVARGLAWISHLRQERCGSLKAGVGGQLCQHLQRSEHLLPVQGAGFQPLQERYPKTDPQGGEALGIEPTVKN